VPADLARDGWRPLRTTDVKALVNIAADLFYAEFGAKGEERYVEAEEWFRYFWKEAKVVATTEQAESLQSYFAQTLWVRPAAAAVAVRADIPQVQLDASNPFASRLKKGEDRTSSVAGEVRAIGRFDSLFSDAEIKEFLTRVLAIGFESVPGEGSAGTASAAYGMLTQFVTKATFEMAWRADTRDLETIRRQGYLSRAAVASVATSMNMDKPWHPFSDPAVNSRIWLRKGQTDNCLMTVVSVAERFEISLAYPKIDLTDALKKVVTNVAIFDGRKVRATALGAASPYIGTVHFPGEPPSPRMITFSHVYLLVLDSWVFDTGSWQESSGKARYPERAVKGIKPSNVIGKVTFLRIHHGPSDEDGFTAFPIASESSFVSQDEFKVAFGDAKFGMYYQQAQAKHREALASGPHAKRWLSTGIGSAPEPLKNDKGQPARPVKASIGGRDYALS
jgi:hypothetical protein